jgi:tetratricopeptide (TPR) repeat protein
MKSSEELFEEAERLEEEGEQVPALQKWRDLAATYPDPNALCRLALLARELSENDEAERALRRAIELDPKLGVAYLALCSMAIHRRDYEEAECLVRQALRIEETRSGYCLLGSALSRHGRREEAKASYLKAIEMDPQFEEAYFNLGVLVGDSDPGEAEALFSRAIELDPDYAEAHRELGWRLRLRDSLRNAEDHIRRAIELQPDDAWAHLYLGNLLWRRGDTASAVAEYEWAREAAPDSGVPVWALANLYENQEEWGKAQALYERALALQPDDVVGNTNFGRMLKRKGNLASARVYSERALLLDQTMAPRRPFLLNCKNRGSRRQGRPS